MHYACLLDYLSFKIKRLMDKMKKEVVLRQTIDIPGILLLKDHTLCSQFKSWKRNQGIIYYKLVISDIVTSVLGQ